MMSICARLSAHAYAIPPARIRPTSASFWMHRRPCLPTLPQRHLSFLQTCWENKESLAMGGTFLTGLMGFYWQANKARKAEFLELKALGSASESRLQKQLEGLDTRLQKQLEGLDTRFQKQLEGFDARHQKRFESLEMKIDSVRSELKSVRSELKEDINGVTLKVEKLRETIEGDNGLRERIVAITSLLTHREKSTEIFQSEFSHMQQRVAILEDRNSSKWRDEPYQRHDFRGNRVARFDKNSPSKQATSSP